jgi:hypothetical protein
MQFSPNRCGKSESCDATSGKRAILAEAQEIHDTPDLEKVTGSKHYKQLSTNGCAN